jgi:hypothetical protein
MEEQKKTSGTQRWTAILVVSFAVVIALAAWRSTRKFMRMEAHAQSPTQVQQLKAGETAKVVVAVAGAKDGRLEGEILEKQSETDYKRTGAHANASFDGETSFVMGKVADVHSGAIVHVTGAVQEGGQIRAKQIVILTGYVQVH